jgi:hypothetical protein
MADVAKMPASVPTGPIGALAGDDGVDRPGDEIRDAGAEGKTSRSVATAGRTETAAAAAGDGEGAREGGANANEDDADARATNAARGGGAIAEGAPSANAPPPASGDADRPDSEERDDEDDENDEDADDPSLATSDHDDETPLIPPGGIPPGGADGAPVRRRSMRSAANITQEELSACFHLPSEAACRRLGIGLTVLKRQCRKFGIKRWPFRKMKSLDRLITNVQAGISPGDQNRTLVKSVEELEEQKQRMQECHELDLDDDTKRLQQAYSKANHKARRAAHQTDMGGVGGLLALSGGAEGGLGASSAAGLLSRQPSGGEKTIAEVLEAAKAQAELLRGVASTIPALLPGAAGSSASMAAAVAAAAAAMSAQSGTAVSAATVSALMHASATRDAGGLAAAAGGPTNAPRDKSTRSDKSDGDAVDARNPTDAVVGAWSPARPVKPPAATAEGAARGDRGDARLEELLSASGRDVAFQRSDARGGDEWDDDARDEGEKALAERSAARGAAAKRERRPGWVETRGRPRKHPRRHEEDAAPSPGEAEGDDPLASLAAAALAVKGRGRGRPLGSKNGSGKNAVAKAGAAAPAGGSAVRKSAVTLLVTEHADRVREALNRTIDALVSVDANDREALARGVNEAVGVESLKLRDALNAALGAS